MKERPSNDPGSDSEKMSRARLAECHSILTIKTSKADSLECLVSK
jgi:hypothetical protein